MKNIFIIITLCLGLLYAQAPFLALPQVSGTVDIRLYPTEGITPGDSVTITFGLPFTRGSMTEADLSTLRILKNANEIPAYAAQLTPWRHLDNPGLDTQSVRVAIVQIVYTFSNAFPDYEVVTAEWGGPARTLNRASLAPPRDSWHQVTTGTFEAVDGIYEPDAYAVLPKDLLCKGILKLTRFETFDDTVKEVKDDAQAMDNIAHWDGHLEHQFASKNFYYSLIDEVDPAVTAANRCPYKTGYEPWLYDRASAMFMLYFRSGFFTVLREAVRNAQFYRNHLSASGFFDLKSSNDAKYSYNECLAYGFWLTGDDSCAAAAERVLPAHNSSRTRWTSGANFFTERHSGFKLLAYTVAYELFGGAYADSVSRMADDLMWLQDGADGQIPGNRVDGGLYHYGRQHDGDWASGTLGASPWMSALVLDPMLRVYALSESAESADFIRRMGNFLNNACSVNGDGLAFPRYAVLYDGSDGQVNEFSDVQHAIETSAGIAWAAYFSRLAGTADTTALLQKADSLYLTYDDQVNYWTRPAAPSSGLTAFRVSPWRKYGWEYRTSHGLSWALQESRASAISDVRPMAGAPDLQVFPNPFNPSTTFEFKAQRATRLDSPVKARREFKVQIYDLSGKLVESLSGQNRLVWQAAGLGSGIYIARVTFNGSAITQKLFLQK